MDVSFIQKHRSPVFLAILICFYLINGICYLRAQTLTSDEASFYNYAVRLLKGQPDRIHPDVDNSKMPVCILNTIPRIGEQLLHRQQSKTDGGESDIVHGRYVTLFVSLLILLFVYQWAKELYGTNAGLFAAFLFSICPNNLANAGLVTTDSYAVLFLVATFYYLWKYCKQGRNRHLIALSLCVALSQLVKQSLFHLYILIPSCLGVYYIANQIRPQIKKALWQTAIFIFINWLVINLGYYFYHTNYTLGAYKFTSHFFIGLQNVLPSWIPVPVPHPFVEGLDQAKYYDQIGGGYDNLSSFGKVTILGKAATGGSFWYYYIVSFFFKTPIAFLVFFTWALWLTLRTKKKFMSSDVFFLLAPVAYYLVIFSFFYKTQCGIRHLIFIYPLLFIFSSAIISDLKTRLKGAAFILVNLFALISVLSYWKNYYPYTNEFIWDKKMAYEYVGAGNLEFLQGGHFLQEYLQQHPEVKRAPTQFEKGTFVISTEDYLDVWNRHQYDWLKNYKPVDHVACTYLVFEINDSTAH